MIETDLKIWVVVTAFNEGQKIDQVLAELVRNNFKVVVVDDGSTDETGEVAMSWPVYVLRHKINRGQGAALQTGTFFALTKGAGVVVHFDGDGQYLVDEILPNLRPILAGEADVVLGSRFLKENKSVPWLKKYLIHPLARLINNLITGVNLTDAHCGWRAMNALAAKKINILQDGMSHNTEIVSQIKKYKLSFTEMPVTVIYQHFGQGIGGGFKILKELLIAKIIN